MYEKALTPTWPELLKLTSNRTVVYMMESASPAEIYSGKSLNIFMPFVLLMQAKGINGPPTPLDQDMLRSINVISASAGPNVRILAAGGHLNWPIGLQTPLLDKTAPLIVDAVSEVMSNRLQLKTYQAILKNLGDMETDLNRRCFKTEEIDTSLYLESDRFLGQVVTAVKGLTDPGAKGVLEGSNIAVGHNVPELCFNLTQRGMIFAPALPGDSASYFSLHHAFVNYITAAQTSSGFQIQQQIKLPDIVAKAVSQ